METEFKPYDECYIIHKNMITKCKISSIHIDCISIITYNLLWERGIISSIEENHIGKTKEELKNKLFN